MSDRMRTPDAIVVGSGATGGLAALELANGGLDVLVLEAGAGPERGGALRRIGSRVARRIRGESAWLEARRRRQPVQSRCYAWPGDPDAFVDDFDHPYVTPLGRPFVWIRSRQPGGRLPVPGHGRLYYRLGPDDLRPPDGRSPAWPLTYEELVPWYASVERRLGMSGGQEGIPWLPDSELSDVRTAGASEAAIRARVVDRWPAARVALCRWAPPHDFLGEAMATGRVTLRTGAVAVGLVRDRQAGRISGVRWIDTRHRREMRSTAPLVFLCASALESTRLLLLSSAEEGGAPFGGASGVLGGHLMDHLRILLRGRGPSFGRGRAGRCLYLPRFDARERAGPPQGRGFGVQMNHAPTREGQGTDVALSSYGEMVPRPGNRVRLDPSVRDVWGIPVLGVDCEHGPEDLILGTVQREALEELADALEVRVDYLDKAPSPPGLANHECGTARMGSSPEDSVVDPFNECWDARGLHLVDGAVLPSQGTQNPTLTYLALTARACARVLGRGSEDGTQEGTAENGTGGGAGVRGL